MLLAISSRSRRDSLDHSRLLRNEWRSPVKVQMKAWSPGPSPSSSGGCGWIGFGGGGGRRPSLGPAAPGVTAASSPPLS
ncbi:hypothetical protein WJX72_006507 [[Myrmecia] bisecta]|uniref:Uncharacterized protein n=1 Tax=[Myrmecia] bisecta TaxID=41462 RepID=A0AAW1QFC2_9CHLO